MIRKQSLLAAVVALMSIPAVLCEDTGVSATEQQWFDNPPPGVETKADVPYLQAGRKETLDLYLPKNRPSGTRSPAVVLLHGGGWLRGDKRQAREIEIGSTLAANAFVAASVNYDLSPSGKYPANLKDCKNAVRFLRANADRLGIDTDRIAVLGGSAGGHLALMVGYTPDDPVLSPATPYPGFSDRVQAVVDFYGVSDIPTRRKTDDQGNPTDLVGIDQLIRTVFGDAAMAEQASPIHHVSKEVPPTLILQGMKDQSVDRDQSIHLAEALRTAGASVELVMLANAGHSFSFKYSKAKSKKPLERDIGPEVIAFLRKSFRMEPLPGRSS
jgi:acetyl esterase/lipase